MVRALPLLVILLAGCPHTGTGECQVDSQCGDGLVCARGDDLCVSATEVRLVKAKWTVNGAVADMTTCAGEELFIRFEGIDSTDTLGFSPVPCFAGQYTIDKLPLRFVSVELGIENGPRDLAAIGSDGIAQLDLMF
jgi:hypothetical protein